MARKLRKLAAITGGIAAVVTGCTAPKKGPQTQPADVAALLDGVLDQDGQPVGKDALLGHWSVLWFYPKAQTSG